MIIKDLIEEYKNSVIDKFSFLITEYLFHLDQIEVNADLCTIVYKKDNIIIRLHSEILDNRFYFHLNDGNKIVLFHEYFKQFDGSINWPDLMPAGRYYDDALDRNVLLLKKYGHDFLSGKQSL